MTNYIKIVVPPAMVDEAKNLGIVLSEAARYGIAHAIQQKKYRFGSGTTSADIVRKVDDSHATGMGRVMKKIAESGVEQKVNSE